MQFFGSFFIIFVFVFAYHFGKCRAIDCKLNKANPDKVAYTITVDLKGRGNFTKVQDAIHSIPSKNREWIKIYLKPGIYREQVKIPREKTCIVMEGGSHLKTSIEWDANGQTDLSSTFTTEADNFVAKHISFKNTYNFKPVLSGPKMTWAVAATIKGDKSSFYGCGFYGIQDTLWDAVGRHYFQRCFIQGAVDFIWGSGQSIYKRSKIMYLGEYFSLREPGYITAQARDSEEDPSGFVFLKGTVNGTAGSTYLGRDYRSHSRVIFDRVIMSDVITPEGWNNSWGHNVKDLVFVESNCEGPGADTSRRVSWEKKLSPAQVKRFTDISFINSPDRWLLNQP